MALKQKLQEFIGDISKLQVTTLTGDLATSVMVDSETKRIQFESILSNLVATDDNPSTVKVVASTLVDFDKDVVQYVQEGADASLLELHNDAVKNSQEARAAFIQAVIDFIPI